MIKSIRMLSLVFSILIIATQTFANSTIISAADFNHIKKLILQSKHPHHLLLALDDDDTLTMMPCPAPTHCQYLGGPSWYKWQSHLPATSKQRIWKTYPQLLDIANLLYTMTAMTIDDPAIPSTLKTADKLGVSTMVVTDRGYRMVHATENQFKKDNIFHLIEKNTIETPTDHTSFPGFYFPKKWDKKSVRRVTYEHGTLYVAGQNKGEIIKQFLQKTNQSHRIHEIIFVDDTMKNVEDVANAYKNDPSVHVISIHFTRMATIKAAFFKGKYAKYYQAMANKQWYAIHDALKKNLLGFLL